MEAGGGRGGGIAYFKYRGGNFMVLGITYFFYFYTYLCLFIGVC